MPGTECVADCDGLVRMLAGPDGCSDADIDKDVHEPRWSDWINRDDPAGQFDAEGIGQIASDGLLPCSKPTGIVCETVKGVPWNATGQAFSIPCTLDGGLVCANSLNDGACLDYRVRLLCEGPFPGLASVASQMCADDLSEEAAPTAMLQMIKSSSYSQLQTRQAVCEEWANPQNCPKLPGHPLVPPRLARSCFTLRQPAKWDSGT